MRLLVPDPVLANLSEPVTRVFDRAVEYLPNILGAALLILIGLAAAYVLRMVARRLTRYLLGRLSRSTPTSFSVESQPLYQSLPGIIGGVVFWIVLLFFVAAGVEALGLSSVSGLFSAVTVYLPRVLVVVVLVFAGMFFGSFAYTRVARVAAATGIAYAEILGRIAQAMIWLIVILISIELLGINSSAIITVLAITGGSFLGAAALAFGLGARTTAGNIVGAHYVQEAYSVGDRVKIGDAEGRIVEISRAFVILDTSDGRVLIPASHFNEQVSTLIEEGD